MADIRDYVFSYYPYKVGSMKFLRNISSFLLLFILLAGASQSYAIPAFARKEGVQCSGCHSAFPALNQLGRLYKLQGFNFTERQMPGRRVTDALRLMRCFLSVQA